MIKQSESLSKINTAGAHNVMERPNFQNTG